MLHSEAVPPGTLALLKKLCVHPVMQDFYDLHILLRELGLETLLDCYARKFPNHDPMIPLRSMIYFEDAEDTPTPKTLTKSTWTTVKADIQTAVRSML